MNFNPLKQAPPLSTRRVHYPIRHGAVSRILFVASLLFLVSFTGAFAENPWNSSSLGWSPTGWNSWDAAGSSWFPHRVSGFSSSYQLPAPRAFLNSKKISPHSDHQASGTEQRFSYSFLGWGP